MWIALKTRCDIMAAVSLTARMMRKQPKAPVMAAKGLWRCLRGSMETSLGFSEGYWTRCSDMPLDTSFAPEAALGE